MSAFICPTCYRLARILDEPCSMHVSERQADLTRPDDIKRLIGGLHNRLGLAELQISTLNKIIKNERTRVAKAHTTIEQLHAKLTTEQKKLRTKFTTEQKKLSQLSLEMKLKISEASSITRSAARIHKRQLEEVRTGVTAHMKVGLFFEILEEMIEAMKEGYDEEKNAAKAYKERHHRNRKKAWEWVGNLILIAANGATQGAFEAIFNGFCVPFFASLATLDLEAWGKPVIRDPAKRTSMAKAMNSQFDAPASGYILIASTPLTGQIASSIVPTSVGGLESASSFGASDMLELLKQNTRRLRLDVMRHLGSEWEGGTLTVRGLYDRINRLLANVSEEYGSHYDHQDLPIDQLLDNRNEFVRLGRRAYWAGRIGADGREDKWCVNLSSRALEVIKDSRYALGVFGWEDLAVKVGPRTDLFVEPTANEWNPLKNAWLGDEFRDKLSVDHLDKINPFIRLKLGGYKKFRWQALREHISQTAGFTYGAFRGPALEQAIARAIHSKQRTVAITKIKIDDTQIFTSGGRVPTKEKKPKIKVGLNFAKLSRTSKKVTIKIKRGDDTIAEKTTKLYRSRDNHSIELAPTVALFESRATRDTSRQLKVEVSTGKKGWKQEASWDFHVVYKG